MKKNVSLIFLSFVVIFTTYLQNAVAQNGATCYKPLVGAGKTAKPINNSILCVDLNGSCNFISSLSNVTDSDTTNLAYTTSTLSVGAGRGVSVKDDINTYTGGYYAGFILNLGESTLLTADILSAFTVSTYNDDVFKESKSGSLLLSATALGTVPGRYYIYFKTTTDFDEIRFVYTSTIGALNNLGIYYATAFDPNCGALENNNICGDQIAGAGTFTTFNNGGGLLTATNALTSITNTSYITDGNKNTAATITLPASIAGLTGYPYIGVLDEKRIYPSGSVTGFVISRPAIATVDVLSSLRVQTYLFGKLQDEGTVSSGIDIGLLTGDGDRTAVSITTTKPYNEVRLVIATTVAISAGLLNVYYAFEQPTSCTSCTDVITTSGVAPYNSASINTYDPDGILPGPARTSELGICISVLGGNYDLINESRVIDGDTNNYASYKYGSGLANLGIACGFQLSTKMTSTIPGGAIAGYVIGVENSSLLNVGLLEGITIRTYKNNVLVAQSTNANLLGLSILSYSNGTKTRIGFRSPGDFDEIQIEFRSGLINAGLLGLIDDKNIRTYYPFVIRDDDNDGVLNCQDKCPTGNDAIDLDGNGLSDCYEQIILPLTLSNFSAKATTVRKVLLSWETLNETNTHQFILERSNKPSSADWKQITTVIAAGTAAGSRTYSYTDAAPLDGINYYRLRTIDRDGKETVSPIRQVNLSAKALLSVDLYPNPVKSGNTIQVATLQSVHYRMIDKAGRVVMNGTLPNGNSTLQAPFSAGVYILEVEALKSGTLKETYKIIVQ